MHRVSIWPAILGLAAAVNVILLLQAFGVLDPVRHSLSYVSGGLVILSLIGWVTEAREVAGPPPADEDEHALHGEEEEEEEEAPGPSFWPVFLAIGIVGIALGLVYAWPYAAAFVSLPVMAAALAFWANDIKQESLDDDFRRQQEAAAIAAGAAPMPAHQALPASGGGLLMPLPPRALAAQAAGGSAIAIEVTPRKGVSRRNLLRLTFWAGLGGGLAALGGAIVDALYPRGVTGFGSVVQAGTIDQYPAGSKTHNLEGKFWLVNLTPEQTRGASQGGLLALWHKCPHLGCTVPWRDDFVFTDPNSGQSHTGWFRCPCHGSTYNDAGVRVFGPAPRSMDVMALTYDPGSKRISVNSGKITKGSTNNPKLATKV